MTPGEAGESHPGVHDYLRREKERIDAALDRATPSANTAPENLHRAIRYSLFAGGKRIRPILCVCAARTVGGPCSGIEAAACALELIHTYSLIHDDLPALDNDDLRRGQPTCHKTFGEAIAILAGDALLTLAFETLTNLDNIGPERKTHMIAELARAAGTRGGMIGGQVADLESEGSAPEATLLESIHRAKTGALLRASLRLGAIYAGADEPEYNALSRFGEHIGLAFQIVDDILDVEASSAALGKTAGKDAAHGKITFPAVYGVEESRRLAGQECQRAHAALSMFGERARRLHELADLIVERQS